MRPWTSIEDVAKGVGKAPGVTLRNESVGATGALAQDLQMGWDVAGNDRNPVGNRLKEGEGCLLYTSRCV